MSFVNEQHLGIVDTWRLHHYNWPIQRLFAGRAVRHLERAHAMKDLLATGRWDVVRADPHPKADGHLSDHVYDVYGRPVATPPTA